MPVWVRELKKAAELTAKRQADRRAGGHTGRHAKKLASEQARRQTGRRAIRQAVGKMLGRQAHKAVRAGKAIKLVLVGREGHGLSHGGEKRHVIYQYGIA